VSFRFCQDFFDFPSNNWQNGRAFYFLVFVIMITASQVNDLRQMTGAGMMACKNALVEANGDTDLAIEILRKKGESKAVEKSDRETKEGSVFVYIKGNMGVMLGVECETDFVARNEKFQALGNTLAEKALEMEESAFRTWAEGEVKALVATIGENMSLGKILKIEAPVIGSYVHTNKKVASLVGAEGSVEVANDVAMQATAMNPKVFNPEDIAEEIIAKEREIWTEQLKTEKKPENIIQNILIGKERKFREESALLTQAFVKDSDINVKTYAEKNATKLLSFIRLAI